MTSIKTDPEQQSHKQQQQSKRVAAVLIVLAVSLVFIVVSPLRGRGRSTLAVTPASPPSTNTIAPSPSLPPPPAVPRSTRKCPANAEPARRLAPPSGTPVEDPDEALRLALENDAAQPLLQDVVSDADAERCIWNNPVMQRCSAQQWKRQLLRRLLKDYRMFDNATDEIKRMVTPDPDCEEFFSRGDLRRFPTNSDGLAEKFTWEFVGDSNTRALFLGFVDLFDDSALVPFRCENAVRGKWHEDRYYDTHRAIFPRPIILPKRNVSDNSFSTSRLRQVPMSDLVDESPMRPGPDAGLSWKRGIDWPPAYSPGRNPVVLIGKDLFAIADNNSLVSGSRFSSKVAPVHGRKLSLRQNNSSVSNFVSSPSSSSSSSSSSLSSSLLRVWHRFDSSSASLTKIKMWNPSFLPSEAYTKISWQVPPQMWRREALRAFRQQEQQQQQQQQSSKARPNPAEFFSPHSDVLTNSDRPKILVRSNVHQDIVSVHWSLVAAVAGRSKNFSACSRRAVDFNDCLEVLPAAELGGPKKESTADGIVLVTPIFFDLRLEEKIQKRLASSRSNEQEMRAATRFGFTNTMEEMLITRVLDALWRYTLTLSTRRNLHMSVFHDMHSMSDVDPAGIGLGKFVREAQGTALRKLMRFEIMRAAGLLSGLDPSSIVDESLREDQQEAYFVGNTEKRELAQVRRRWNGSAADFQDLILAKPRDAYHLRNARNILVTDVHVAARRYIRKELLAKVESPAVLRAVGRLMARTFFTDAYSGFELRSECIKELTRRGFKGNVNTTCQATRDPMHFRRPLENIPLQNLLASVVELERCRTKRE